VIFEVSRRRVIRYKLRFRLSQPDTPALLVTHLCSGFYLRVIEEGEADAGDTIAKHRRD
jgi:MOSC domain-containing protein YiiM